MAEELRPVRRASSPIFISFLPVSLRTNALDLKSALTFSIVRWVVATRPEEDHAHRKQKIRGRQDAEGCGNSPRAIADREWNGATAPAKRVGDYEHGEDDH